MDIMLPVYALYGLVLAAGGYAGYRVAGSSASLLSGIISGVVMLADAFLVHSNARIGVIIGLVASFVLGAFFLYRFLKTRKAMPGLVMMALSEVVAALSLVMLLTANRAH